MSCALLPAMTFVLASSTVAPNIVYLRDPKFILARDSPDKGDGKGASSTTSSSSRSSDTTTSTTTTSSGGYHTSTTSITQSSTTTATGTFTGSSSVYTSSTSSSSMSSSLSSAQNNSTITTSQGLSTAARVGLSFGIMFFLIFSAVLFCCIKRWSRRARENASYGHAILSSEVRQYRPPDIVASRERELPPPPRLDTAHPNSYDISHSPLPSAISSVAPLLSHDSRSSSHSISAWNRNSALSQGTDIPQIAMQQMSTLPNPHDPFSAPARSASFPSTMVSMASSSPNSSPSDASALGSAAMTNAFTSPGGDDSSASQPQRQLSALHTDLARYQKELELDHTKRGLETREELQDPPPEYSS